MKKIITARDCSDWPKLKSLPDIENLEGLYFMAINYSIFSVLTRLLLKNKIPGKIETHTLSI